MKTLCYVASVVCIYACAVCYCQKEMMLGFAMCAMAAGCCLFAQWRENLEK